MGSSFHEVGFLPLRRRQSPNKIDDTRLWAKWFAYNLKRYDLNVGRTLFQSVLDGDTFSLLICCFNIDRKASTCCGEANVAQPRPPSFAHSRVVDFKYAWSESLSF